MNFITSTNITSTNITSTNMFDFIDKLRKKPLAERKMIALTVSASITAIIFFIWISTFWIKPSSSESEPNGKPVLSSITPLSSIKDNVAGVYSNFVKFIGVGEKSPDLDVSSPN